MCQAIPRRVLEVATSRARVDIDGEPRWVPLAGALADLAPGEYVVVYAGLAVERVSPEEAEAQLRFLRELETMFADEGPRDEREARGAETG